MPKDSQSDTLILLPLITSPNLIGDLDIKEIVSSTKKSATIILRELSDRLRGQIFYCARRFCNWHPQ